MLLSLLLQGLEHKNADIYVLIYFTNEIIDSPRRENFNEDTYKSCCVYLNVKDKETEANKGKC